MTSVFLNYDQQGLDEAYDQSKWAPNRVQILQRYQTTSDLARARLGDPIRMQYGQSSAEAFDLYRSPRTPAPIQVFVHGGAWRSGSAREYVFPAELFTSAGAHYVALDFSLVQDIGGDLRVMANQIRRAVASIYNRAKDFGGDADRIYISGHSSGAHLAAVTLTTDWRSDFALPPDLIKGGICVSGMYDLLPVRLSSRSTYVAFDDHMEMALSPQRHLRHLSAPIVVAYGSEESPEFQRQARDFANAVSQAGKPCQLLYAEGYNHFEIIETLGNPFGLLGRCALAQMGLTLRLDRPFTVSAH